MVATDGMTVVYEGREYAFCSEHCLKVFEENSEAYLKKENEA